jgi:hypothetical protein
VNKLTPEEVHDGDKEFAGRKAKPSNEMGFKIDNGEVIYRRNIHLRNERFQPNAQPAGGVIGRAICLSGRGLLLVVRQHGGGLVHHLLNGRIGGGRSHRNIALHPKSSLGLVGDNFTDDVKVCSVSLGLPECTQVRSKVYRKD